MERDLNSRLKESLAQISFTMAKGSNLIYKKRQVNAPKGKVQQKYPVALKKGLHLSIQNLKFIIPDEQLLLFRAMRSDSYPRTPYRLPITDYRLPIFERI